MISMTNLFYFLISFIIAACAQPDLNPFFSIVAACLGYALFWKSISEKKNRFWLSFFWFASVQAIHLSWFASDRYVGPTIYLLLILIASFLGLCFAFLSFFIKKEISFSHIVLLTSFWTISEWSRLFFLCGYAWDPIGLSLTATQWGMQMATIGGIFFLSFWVILTNLLAFKMLYKRRYALSWIAIAALPYLFGYFHINYHEKEKNESKVHVVLVQTALYPEEKAPLSGLPQVAISPPEQWKRILKLIKKHEHKPIDLIVLPEGSVPYGTNIPIFSPQVYYDVFGKWPPILSKMGNDAFASTIAEIFKADVVIGLDDQNYNAAFLFKPDGRIYRYEKRVLVPMGEYIPFEWCKKFLKKWGIVDSFIAGKKAKVFPSVVPIGLSICYEETFSNLMRDNRLNGSKMLVNLTNDAWYPHSRLPEVHYIHGRLRSVEQGVPLVRACNSGVTCAIDSLGKTIARLENTTADALHVAVPTYSYSTFYTKIGDKGIIIFCGFLISLTLGYLLPKRPSLVKVLGF